MRTPTLQTVPTPPRIRALIILRTPAVRPHREIRDLDIRARVRRGAENVQRGSLGAVGAVAFPVGEGDAVVENSVAGDGVDGGPVSVQVEGVGVFVADEVVEGDLRNGAVAAVGFEHVHLVRVDGVDIVVFDFGDVWRDRLVGEEMRMWGWGEGPVSVPRLPIAQPPLQLQ